MSEKRKIKNDGINLYNGKTVFLTEGTHIMSSKVIAGKGRERSIDNIDALLESFGGTASEWQKKKGFAYIMYDGESVKVEVHWYEEPTIGEVGAKIKPQKGGTWYVED